MKLLDLNLLLYAVNRDSPRHPKAKNWLERAMTEDEPVGIPWVVVLGFLRLSTSRSVFPRPLSPADAVAVVDSWLERPLVRAVGPGEEHWRILKSLLVEAGTAQNLTTDAHIAALAIENGSELYSTNGDFVRFSGLRWRHLFAE